jgi:hypothetical protein
MVGDESLPVVCCISLPITINGVTRIHTMLVVCDLRYQCILGADFINKHQLLIDNRLKKVYFNQKNLGSHNIDHQAQMQNHHTSSVSTVECDQQSSTRLTLSEVIAFVACLSKLQASEETTLNERHMNTNSTTSSPHSIISSPPTRKIEVINKAKRIPKPGEDSCYRPLDSGHPSRILPDVDMSDPRIRDMSPRHYQRSLAFFARKQSMTALKTTTQ